MASPVRRALVEALEKAAAPARRQGGEAAQGRTAAELAEVVGLHVTTVRFHLDQLVDAGVLRSDEQRHEGPGRPRKVYAVVPGMTDPAAAAEPLRLLTSLLVDTVSASMTGAPMDPVEAGRAWAREHVPLAEATPAATPQEWLGRVERVTDSLRVWGYHPQLSRDEDAWTTRVELTDCPFMDLARRDTTVVCGIHAGLIAEAAHRLGAPDAEATLEPFVGPARCLAHIGRPSNGAGRPTTRTPITRTAPTTRTATTTPTTRTKRTETGDHHG